MMKKNIRFAVHFGINKYDREFYGPDVFLNQCVNDARRMEQMTVAAGFDEARVFADERATSRQWKSQMAEMAKTMNAGDVFLFSCSSHGTYSDAIGTGSYESPKGKRSTGLCFHDRIIWDYEVLAALKKFKKGVVVVWISDACFAESNWREVRAPNGQPAPSSAVRYARAPVTAPTPRPTQGDKRQIRATLLTYSSSNVWQPSYEDANGGAYTAAICMAYRTEPGLTYYGMQKKAAQIVAGAYPQTPIFETVRPGRLTGATFLTTDLPHL